MVCHCMDILTWFCLKDTQLKRTWVHYFFLRFLSEVTTTPVSTAKCLLTFLCRFMQKYKIHLTVFQHWYLCFCKNAEATRLAERSRHLLQLLRGLLPTVRLARRRLKSLTVLKCLWLIILAKLLFSNCIVASCLMVCQLFLLCILQLAVWACSIQHVLIGL